MEWLLGAGALYLFLQIVLPLAAIAAIAYLAYRWASREREVTFSASEPDRHELKRRDDQTEEWRFELEDVHDENDQPPRT